MHCTLLCALFDQLVWYGAMQMIEHASIIIPIYACIIYMLITLLLGQFELHGIEATSYKLQLYKEKFIVI